MLIFKFGSKSFKVYREEVEYMLTTPYIDNDQHDKV